MMVQSLKLATGPTCHVSKFLAESGKVPKMQAWLASRNYEDSINYRTVKDKISYILRGLSQNAVISLINSVKWRCTNCQIWTSKTLYGLVKTVFRQALDTRSLIVFFFFFFCEDWCYINVMHRQRQIHYKLKTSYRCYLVNIYTNNFVTSVVGLPYISISFPFLKQVNRK